MVTRPKLQADGIAKLIEDAGARVLRFPAIEIHSTKSSALARLIDGLDAFDLAIFISRNAVEQGLARVRERREWPTGLAIGAIGSGTLRALQAQGHRNAFAPEGPSDSEALLANARLHSISGKRVVIFRGEGGREFLGSTLRERGAIVEYAECYRRSVPANDPRVLIGELSRGAVHAVVISSGEGLTNFAGLLGPSAEVLLAHVPFFVPHPRVAGQASGLGITETLIAGIADEETLAALVAYFGRTG